MSTHDDPAPSQSASDNRNANLSPDDAMPDVVAPTAGFLIQLFIVPAAIVSVIVLLWLTVTWLVQDNSGPRQLLVQLRQNTDQRYLAAYKLAETLRQPRYEKLKRDHEFASELASILNNLIDDAQDDKAAQKEEGPVNVRVYIASALGLFHVDDGLDVLIKAAETERDPAEIEVRLAALQAIALLTDNVRTPLTERIFLETARLCKKLALDLRANTDGIAQDAQGELARQFDDVASDAERLAADRQRPGDLAKQATLLSETLSSLALALKTSQTDDHERVAKNIQTLASAMTSQAQQLKRFEWHDDAELTQMLLRAADERHEKTRPDPISHRDVTYDHLVRLGAAYCLGLMGGPESIAKLEQMLDDGNSEVRYNSAASLCRHGHASAAVIELLIEMISEPQVSIPDPIGEISDDKRERRVEATRQRVIISALRAVEVLAKENQTDDLGPLSAAVQRIIDQKPPANIRGEAMRIAEHLKKRSAL